MARPTVYTPLPTDRPLNDEEMAEFMVVTKGRRPTQDEIAAKLNEEPYPEPIVPALTMLPITPDMPPVLRELIRNQVKLQLHQAQWIDYSRRRDVGHRVLLGQINSTIPCKEWVWTWMDEHFAAKMAAMQAILDDTVKALSQLKVRTFDFIGRGIVLVPLGRFGRWLHRSAR